MQKYFENTKTYRHFRALLDKLDGERRGEFRGAAYRLYKEKQYSEAELPTFKLTLNDIEQLRGEPLLTH